MARRALRPGEILPDQLGLHYQQPGWQRALDAGDVADAADDAHPVATMAAGSTAPVYVSLGFFRERLAALHVATADPGANVLETVARLEAGEVVWGWTAAYQLAVPGRRLGFAFALPRHHVATHPMGTP